MLGFTFKSRYHKLTCVLIATVVGTAIYYAVTRDRIATAGDIAAGKALFLHEWTVNDPLCGEGDGLGPVFNARSCVACHSQGGVGGGGGKKHNVMTFEVDPGKDRKQVVSHVVHKQSTQEIYQETQQTVRGLFPVIPGAARVVAGCSVQLTDHNPIHFDEVNSPALFGVGVIDSLSDYSLVSHNAKLLRQRIAEEFNGNFKHNGSGFTRSHGMGKIGKFGWKGQFATLEDFVASACAMELGLTNPYVSQPIPREHNEDTTAKNDMTKQQLFELVSFIRNLPAPTPVWPEDPDALQRCKEGEKLFAKIQCTDCHVKDIAHAKDIYTDFKLYSLERDEFEGGGGSYGGFEVEVDAEFERPSTVPLPEHWKTPPLWGVADTAPYFHDGQSATLVEAIRRHLGDAKHSSEQFNKLPKNKRAMLIEFLQTLRAPQPDESLQAGTVDSASMDRG